MSPETVSPVVGLTLEDLAAKPSWPGVMSQRLRLSIMRMMSGACHCLLTWLAQHEVGALRAGAYSVAAAAEAVEKIVRSVGAAAGTRMRCLVCAGSRCAAHADPERLCVHDMAPQGARLTTCAGKGPSASWPPGCHGVTERAAALVAMRAVSAGIALVGARAFGLQARGAGSAAAAPRTHTHTHTFFRFMMRSDLI